MSILIRTAIWTFFVFSVTIYTPSFAANHTTGGGLGGNATEGLGTADAGKSFASLSNEQEKKSWAMKKVVTILKLLSKSGTNPTEFYKPKHTGTSGGYDFTIPGTNFAGSTFYTRPVVNADTEVWHIALSFAPDALKTSPLTQAYNDLAQILGTPKHKMLVLIVSEADATVNVKDLPPSLIKAMETFGDGSKISLGKGINFFTAIETPTDGAFGVIQTALMMGGTVKGGSTLGISGSVGYDVLGAVLKDNTETSLDTDKAALVDAEKKKNNIPAVSINVTLPSVVPVPFNKMDAAKAKKIFFMEIDSTSFGIKYDKNNQEFAMEAGQKVSLWIAGKEFLKTDRTISFELDKSDTTNSTYKVEASATVPMDIPLLKDSNDFNLKEVSLSGSVKINIAKKQWQPTEVNDDAVRNSGITIGGNRDKKGGWQSARVSEGATRNTDTTIGAKNGSTSAKTTGETGPAINKKTTELSFALGVTLSAKGISDKLKGALGLSTAVEQGGKARIKEVFFQFDGDAKTGGLDLGKIPALKKIPGVNKLTINGLGIGITPPATGSKLGFYLYSAMEWKDAGLKGQMAVMKRDKSFYMMSRVTDFSVSKVLKSIKPGVKVPGVLDGLEMPSAIMILNTTATAKSASTGDSRSEAAQGASNLTLDKLPGQIKTMFEGIVTQANGKIPIYGDGLSILGAVDLDQDKDGKLIEKLANLGVNIDGPLIMGGSIGGIETGNPAIALFTKLPNFKFTESKRKKSKFVKRLREVIHFTEAGGELFIEFNPVGPIFNIGIGGTMGLKMPRIAGTGKGKGDNILVMKGDLYANTSATGEGIRVAGYIKKPWEDPFGFEGITLTNAAILMGADAEGALEYGHGGDIKFDLSGSGEKVESKPVKKPKNQSAMRAKLVEMDKQFADAANIKESSYGFASILNLNFDAAGIPIPKKIGWSLKSNGISIPAAIDIFDLFLKGLITGPLADALANELKGNNKKVFKAMQKRFKDENRSRPSERIAKKFPFPLDALYLKNVELFIATPGAVLPGFPALDGNMGLKLKGELYVRNLRKPSKTPVRVGKADIDLTLGGLNFGDIKDKIKKSYLKFVSANIDGMVAALDCPKGAFYDVGLTSCWSCPKKYKRTVSSVTGAKACSLRTVSRQKAKKLNKVNQPWTCAKGTFFAARNGGECWKCNGTGFTRFGSTAAVTSNKACSKIDLTKVTTHGAAKKYKKASGKGLSKTCPKGQFWHIGNGYCYSCPKGMVRTARKISGKKACMKIDGLAKYTGAKVASAGRPSKVAFSDIGTGYFYSCPKGHKRTAASVKGNKACKKVTRKLAKAKSEPRGQIRNKANKLCFGAKNQNLKINAAVVAQKCLDQDSRFQSWYMDHLNRIRPLKQLSFKKGKAGAMCLEVVANDKGKPDTKLIIARCSKQDKPSQQWLVDEDFLIHSQLDAGSCVSFSGKGAAGSAMTTGVCITDKDKKRQAWSFGSKLFKPAKIVMEEVDSDDGASAKSKDADEKKLQKKRKEWSEKRAAAAEKRATARKAKKAEKKAAKKQKLPSAKANSCQVCVFKDINYKGKFYCRKTGATPKLSSFKLNDKVSSVKFIGKTCAKSKLSLSLYNKINYKSDKIVIKKNTSNLKKLKRGKKKKKNWNDVAGSFKFALKK